MKGNKTLMAGCLALAGFVMIPMAQAGATPAPQGKAFTIAENTFSQSVKETYRDAKQDLKQAVNNITDNGRTDDQQYREEHREDLKDYQKAVQDARKDYRDEVQKARKDYMDKRDDARKAYLKDHRQLPEKEDIEQDLNSVPMK